MHKRNNSTQVDDTQDIDIVIPMYNLIEYSNIYSKTSGSLWQYYKIIKNKFIDFPTNSNNDISFKFKQQITGQTGNDGSKNVEITV